MLLASVLVGTLRAEPVLKQGARVAIVGDSITEYRGYTRLIELYLTVCVPQFQARCFEFGWSGENAGSFWGRMDRDLPVFKPDVVTLCYGMNDGQYRAFAPDIGAGYDQWMRAIVSKLKSNGVTVVVGGPGVVDSKYFTRNHTPPDAYNENLGQLSAIARKIAGDDGFPFADVHDPMLVAMTNSKAAFGADYAVCPDGVHPLLNGYLVMAYAFLKAMGFDGQIGTITVDLSGRTSATDGHKVLSADKGKIELESTRYPFCFWGDAKSPNGTRSILPYVPFNQELNRFTLVVKNLTTPKARITWGAATSSFTREQLAAGINLAAEFPQNPFNGPFNAVADQISGKQVFERFMIIDALAKCPDMLAAAQYRNDPRMPNIPEIKDAIEAFRQKLIASHEKLAQGVAAAFQPVKHTLVIQPGE